MSVIELDSVSRWYGNVLGLSRVSLAFEPGVTALLGPNGAGKSTLLKLISGLLQPSSGTVSVLGQNPFANPDVFQTLGTVPEEEEFRARVCAIDWLSYLLQLSGVEEDDARARGPSASGLARRRDAARHDFFARHETTSAHRSGVRSRPAGPDSR